MLKISFPKTLVLSLTAAALTAAPVCADAPKVDAVKISGTSISVTISHPDTGWDHYADGWEVLDAQGERLGFRELTHPHVDEQPFTRTLGGVQLPAGAKVIYIRTRDSVHGWSSETHEVKLPQ